MESHSEWRSEIRAFLALAVTNELLNELERDRGRTVGPHRREFESEISQKGWYGVSWPPEYGGLGRSNIDQLILIDELLYAGVPGLPISVTSIGPAIMHLGTEEQKRRWIPGIASGDISFALAYSEPNAGTDLASLKTKAVRDGDSLIVNGMKSWNSYAHTCTHLWTAVRTDTGESKHKGISVIVIPVEAVGIRVVPIDTWADVRVSEIAFDDVVVPMENCIGDMNEGWRCIVRALEFERVSMASTGGVRRLYEQLLDSSMEAEVSGHRLVDDDPLTAFRLAELWMEMNAARLMSYDLAARIDRGESPTAEASMSKVFLTELRARLADIGMAIHGMRGIMRGADAPLGGELEWTYRQAPFLRFGGGTNEIQRDIIAQRGLGLPR